MARAAPALSLFALVLSAPLLASADPSPFFSQETLATARALDAHPDAVQGLTSYGNW